MATGRPLLSDLRTAVRDNLDEATAAQWADARLNRCLTRAADAVLMEVRKVRQDWLTISRASTSGSLTIYGVTYDSSGLGIAAGTAGSAVMLLPPDCLEVRRIECITTGYEDVRFVLTSISDDNIDRARFVSANNVTSVPPSVFYCSFGGGITEMAGSQPMTYQPLSTIALDIRVFYVSSCAIVTTAGVAIRAFTTDTDELVLPHPLYMAVEEVAAWRAQMQDHDPMAGAWDAAARTSVARFIGSASRQSQDPVVVQGLFE